jgi:hypothetical protein
LPLLSEFELLLLLLLSSLLLLLFSSANKSLRLLTKFDWVTANLLLLQGACYYFEPSAVIACYDEPVDLSMKLLNLISKERKMMFWSETCWTHCPQGFIRGNAQIPQDLTDPSQWGYRTSKKQLKTGWCLRLRETICEGGKFLENEWIFVLQNFSVSSKLYWYAYIYIWSCKPFGKERCGSYNCGAKEWAGYISS